MLHGGKIKSTPSPRPKTGVRQYRNLSMGNMQSIHTEGGAVDVRSASETNLGLVNLLAKVWTGLSSIGWKL